MRQLHPGPERHLPEMRDLRRHLRLQLNLRRFAVVRQIKWPERRISCPKRHDNPPQLASWGGLLAEKPQKAAMTLVIVGLVDADTARRRQATQTNIETIGNC